MSKQMIFCGLATLAISMSIGCCGPHWRIGIWKETECSAAVAEVPCEDSYEQPGFSIWYPGKHVIRGLNHFCGLFTCYGCGGNHWCDDGCGPCGGIGWTSVPNAIPYESSLEPVPTSRADPTPVPEKTSAEKPVQQ